MHEYYKHYKKYLLIQNDCTPDKQEPLLAASSTHGLSPRCGINDSGFPRFSISSKAMLAEAIAI